MAKPIKLCAEYFYHDADMRNDIKVKALRRKFPHVGYAVWNFLLEVLTDSDGFEIEFTPLNQELLAADFDVSVETLSEIVNYCLTLELLQKTEDGKNLYSGALQKRLQAVIDLKDKRRKAGIAGMNARWGKSDNVSGDGNNTPLQSNSSVITPDNEENRIEKKGSEKKRKESKVDIPFAEVVDLWNSICVSLPKVKTLNDTRRQKIKSRLNEIAPKPEDRLGKIKELFERVEASDFLTGNTGWQATFDWIFENGNNWQKVMEGNYDNSNRRGRNHQRQITSPSGVTLGVGEFIEQATGRRTYGSGMATIPPTAPARPSEKHQWDSKTQAWILL